jgi:hypothetical protein
MASMVGLTTAERLGADFRALSAADAAGRPPVDFAAPPAAGAAAAAAPGAAPAPARAPPAAAVPIAQPMEAELDEAPAAEIARLEASLGALTAVHERVCAQNIALLADLEAAHRAVRELRADKDALAVQIKRLLP